MRRCLLLACLAVTAAASGMLCPDDARADKETLNPITRERVVVAYGHVPSHQEMKEKGLEMAAGTLEALRDKERAQETIKACRAVSR